MLRSEWPYFSRVFYHDKALVGGRGLCRTSKASKTCQEVSRLPVLTLPKSEELSLQMGMRTRSEGTQASGAGESHTQDANVAEVSHGKPVIVDP
jgi:hypothetical protein